MRTRKLYALFIATTALGLYACNGTEQAVHVEPDWIHNEDPQPQPTPTPTSTATPPPVGKLYTGPDEVAKYVNKFVSDAQAQGVDVTPDMRNPGLVIQIASLDYVESSVVGLCETGTNIRRVTFDPDFWNTASEAQREILAHHELGHCVLYRGHRSDMLSSGVPASMMYPSVLPTSTYQNNYAHYQSELFTYGAMATTADGLLPETVHICDGEHL